MMRPSATVSRSPLSSAVANPSASVKMRSISARPRSSMETTSNFGSRAMLLRFAYEDAVEAVHLAQLDVNPLTFRGRNILADVVRANRHLALAAIDQHRELNRFGAAQIGNRAKRRAHRAAGVEHIIDEDDAFAIERKRDVATDETRVAGRAFFIIAVRGNIEGAGRDIGHPHFAQRFEQAFGKRSTAAHDANEH